MIDKFYDLISERVTFENIDKIQDNEKVIVDRFGILRKIQSVSSDMGVGRRIFCWIQAQLSMDESSSVDGRGFEELLLAFSDRIKRISTIGSREFAEMEEKLESVNQLLNDKTRFSVPTSVEQIIKVHFLPVYQSSIDCLDSLETIRSLYDRIKNSTQILNQLIKNNETLSIQAKEEQNFQNAYLQVENAWSMNRIGLQIVNAIRQSIDLMGHLKWNEFAHLDDINNEKKLLLKKIEELNRTCPLFKQYTPEINTLQTQLENITF